MELRRVIGTPPTPIVVAKYLKRCAAIDTGMGWTEQAGHYALAPVESHWFYVRPKQMKLFHAFYLNQWKYPCSILCHDELEIPGHIHIHKAIDTQ